MSQQSQNPAGDPETPASGAGERGYALFDLDHTLLPFDTQVLFCDFVIRREPWRVLHVLWFLPVAPLGAMRVVSLRWLKRLFSSYLWKMPRERLRRHAREFAERVVPRLVYPDVMAELRRHQKAGRITILNSASPGLYVEEIARVLGFDHWAATRLVRYEVMPFLPEIDGPNNKHGAKIPAMERFLPPDFSPSSGDKLPDSWGYSDSAADLPMLSLCEHAMMIHPGKKFARVGAERGWWSLLPERPYRGRWGGRLATLLQIFGLYRLPDSGAADGA
ncbi:MAG: HAD-IB family hydrolase [Verrucomicrobiae bacterium]|nr:HAD-IB family hydrolase [Verrucomicrobiae bacterium]MCP5540011.1 HAD-IB family hydrolase [Akkermansiaceae bacterium]MCP5549946.1 HAD-IB family hydrolase [Akkermansiaceae bacterium]